MTRLGRTEKQSIEHSGEVKSGVVEVPILADPEQWDLIARRQQLAISKPHDGDSRTN
jgi:hypothetical protein